jgi:Arc/MetJ-type ribon-helix-helix transcriptional regulator
MTITFPPTLGKLVEHLLRTGRYANEGEAVSEALRVLEHQEFGESPAVEAALLDGVRSLHLPCDMTVLNRIRQNLSLMSFPLMSLLANKL